jgi:hypothetical protein
MKPTILSRPSAGRYLSVLAWALALTLIACGNDVNVGPTAPIPPDFEPVGERSLHIAGSLEAKRDTCLEATVLFDGKELPGARATCPDGGGCAELELEAVTPSSSGRHTISFQVLDQSAKAVEYLARGRVLVTRDGIHLGGVNMNLGPKSATLRPGERVTFEIVFTD